MQSWALPRKIRAEFSLVKEDGGRKLRMNSCNFNDSEDDFEELNEAQEEIADNSSNIGFGQVQREELEAVLSRIATKSCNIPEEYKIASRTLSIITCSESQEKVLSFFLCVRQAFSVLYSVATKDKNKQGYSD